MPRILTKNRWFFLLILMFLSISPQAKAQIKLGILPVVMPSESVEPGLAQSLDSEFDNFIVSAAGSVISVKTLSNEHLILILKGIPFDTDNLSEDALKTICKNDRLDFLIQCRIGPREIADNYAAIPLNFETIDDKGKVFRATSVNILRKLPEETTSLEMWLNPTVKSRILELLNEIKQFNY